MTHQFVFSVATTPAELEQVHRLNYRTFVEEIPQHAPNDARVLVDKFDADNVYFVCKVGDRVVGMIALRTTRPFSLDAKLPDIDHHLPPGRLCEIRLLSVEPEFRNGVVFRGLARELTRYCVANGFDIGVISGTVRQIKLYRHLGFIPFGPLVGTADAPYQPMYITWDSYDTARDVVEDISPKQDVWRFLPGPVDVHPDVLAAYSAPPRSHRDAGYLSDVQHTRALLRQLTRASAVEIVVGTGTLANDIVAAQIAALDVPGVVFTNGEFGDRLVDHARRAGLAFAVERLAWGDAFDARALRNAANRHPTAPWWWLVHHETSTGVLNDLDAASTLCSARKVALCVDCVSSIGVVPLDLSRVWLASAVSGKGLGGIAGLSMVFHPGYVLRSERTPRYLDLALYVDADGVPFTQPSGVMAALRVATERTLARDLAETRALAGWLRDRLRRMGFTPVADDAVACPGIVTLAHASAIRLGDDLARLGFALSYRSDYLRERNWIQIALMGDVTREKLTALLRAMRRVSASAA